LKISIKTGKLVGLIGNIGSGKTSLINSLFGETITNRESMPEI
jgi:ABC-type multidrug transport system ATPase subunit